MDETARSTPPLTLKHLALVALALATARPGRREPAARPRESEPTDGAGKTQDGTTAGRDANSPTEMPARAWKDVLLRAWRESGDDNVGLVSAGVAFYSFLAMVPLLGAIVLTYGLLSSPESLGKHITALAHVLPREAARLIGDQLAQVLQTSGSKKGLGLATALALALFSARGAVGGIISSLNIAYEEKEKRGFLAVNLLALGITAAAVAMAVLGIAIVSALGLLDVVAPKLGGFGEVLLNVASYVLMALVASAAAATLYRYGPSRDEAKWRWITPGTLLFGVAWVLLSLGFGFYARNFGHYGATYGSLSGVVVLLTLMYFSAYILLFGAEINSELEHQTARDTTAGAPRPEGQRGAWAADTVAGEGR